MDQEWKNNKGFVALAEFRWGSDCELATKDWMRLKGTAAACRRMELRWQGYIALPEMARIAGKIAASVRDIRGAG